MKKISPLASSLSKKVPKIKGIKISVVNCGLKKKKKKGFSFNKT